MTEKAKADIVERLRSRVEFDWRYYPPAENCIIEAADEIERLRSLLLRLTYFRDETVFTAYRGDVPVDDLYPELLDLHRQALNPQEKP